MPLAATLLATPLSAQVGETTDIITGVVVGMDAQPLSDVVIEAVSLETEVSRTATTDQRGRYTILFPDGGGQYRMTARMIGAMPQSVILVRHADEDRLIWDVQLQQGAFALDPLIVTGEATRRRVQVPDRPTPGSSEQVLTTDMVASLPISAEDLALLAVLVPGVVVIDPTDSTEAAYSVAGQRPDANQLTLDGMSYGSGQVPQEGVRATRVVTNTYDVARGRFSGGLMATTTRSGANAVQGSISYSLRDHNLAFEEGEETAFTSGFTQHALGGGVGGPLVSNRLFAYLSGQLRLREDLQPSLTAATPDDLVRLGIADDSVARFLAVVDGLGAAPTERLNGDRSNTGLNAMLRADYLISSSHTLTLRGDWRTQGQEPTRLGPTALPETSGESGSDGGGLMAGLSSRFGQRVVNEARVYASTSTRQQDPYWLLPQGRVRVGSDLEDGSSAITTFVMGGTGNSTTTTTGRSVEASNEISWLPGRAAHRLKLGGLFRAERSADVTASNRLGTFTYNSLADLEANQPASYRRTLDTPERRSTSLEYALYAGDVWMFSRAFQLTYGLRAEGTVAREPPAYNPQLDASLGVRTDRLPTEFDLSPRVGFTWMVGNVGPATPPALILRGGGGKFRSPLPQGLLTQAQTSTGLADAETVLECVGAAVPVPDWPAYRLDPATIPSACAGPSTPVAARAPTAVVFADEFATPKAWRVSLGAQRNLTTLLRLSVDLLYARGVDQYGFRDLNLETSAGFTLPGEANRPVFVDPLLIVPQTGAITSRVSRVDSSFAQVLEIGSGLASETKQATVSLGGVTRGGVVLRLSYTWSDVRDQSSQSSRFGGARFGGTSTAGDPNVAEWGRSSYERRHSLLATVSYPFGPSFDVTAVGRLMSGTPYTPMVAEDINGDGAANDRAFVFDPADLPAMQALLDGASGGARRCLERQIGGIAERNSCVGPWEGSLELQLNYRPTILGLGGRAMVSVTTMNLLHGIDQLVHGGGGLAGWGLRTRPDDQLLFVTGFDPVARTFTYAVNERFGATEPSATAFRQPFQIGIQVRATFGPDRGRDALMALRGAGRGGGMGGMRGMGPGAGGLTPADFVERFTALLVNPPEMVLEHVDTLDLSAEQVRALALMRDSLMVLNDSIATALRAEVEAAGGGDARQLVQLIRSRIEEVRERARASLEAVRALLTDEQWDRLPERIRTMGRQQPGMRRPGGG